MFAYLYEWVRSLAYYMVLMTAVLQVIPNKEYKKYIQFYMGLVVVLLLCTPILKVMSLEDDFESFYHSNSYEFDIEELELQTEYLREVELDAYISY